MLLVLAMDAGLITKRQKKICCANGTELVLRCECARS